MKGKMQGMTLIADWQPKPGFRLGAKDIEGRQTYLGSLVWRNPRLEMREITYPTPARRGAAGGEGLRYLRVGRAHGAGGRDGVHRSTPA